MTNLAAMGALRPSRRAMFVAPLLIGPTMAGAMAPPLEIHMRLKEPTQGPLTVALTFDACPGGFDQRIASALVAMRVPATIFVTGRWLEQNPMGWSFFLAHRELFALENHGARHIPPILGGPSKFGLRGARDLAAVKREVAGGAAAITRGGGRAPGWYRGASGYYSPEPLPAIRAMGFAIAGFSLNGDVGASLSANAVAKRLASAADGDVVVAHINQPRRASGVGVVAGVDRLKRRGARFVRLDEVGPAGVEYGAVSGRS